MEYNPFSVCKNIWYFLSQSCITVLHYPPNLTSLRTLIIIPNLSLSRKIFVCGVMVRKQTGQRHNHASWTFPWLAPPIGAGHRSLPDRPRWPMCACHERSNTPSQEIIKVCVPCLALLVTLASGLVHVVGCLLSVLFLVMLSTWVPTAGGCCPCCIGNHL